MIVERDKLIIEFIETIGYATIKNIADMYFTNKRYSYDVARKRLKKIAEMGEYIRVFKNQETNELVYVPYDSKIKRVSIHNIKVLEYLCGLKTLGCDIQEIEIEPIFNNIKPDIYVSFKFNGYMYYHIVEMQIRHDYIDLKRFKDNDTVNAILDKTSVINKETGEKESTMPQLIIIQNTNKDYQAENDTQFKITQLDVNMEDIAKVLCY